MEKITVTNRDNSESITFDRTLPYLLGEITGISDTDIVPQIDDAYGLHGSIRRGAALLKTRYIKFDFWTNAASHALLHAQHDTLHRVLSSTSEAGLLLVYENDNGKWQIETDVIYGPTLKPEKGKDRLLTAEHYEVGLAAWQPLWESFIEYSTKIVGIEGGATFPLTFPFTLATTADNIQIDNTGQEPTPVRVEFRGPATGDCTIEKVETGEEITVTQDLLAGEKLIIDTDLRQPSVTFVNTSGGESSAFNKIAATVAFFQLTPGVNTIAFAVTGGTPEVYLYYRLRYRGV